MGLLDDAKKDSGVKTEATAPATAGKKKSNSEYQKKQRENIAKYGAILVDLADGKKKAGDADVKEAADFFAKRGQFERKASSVTENAQKNSVFAQLFGEAPKVGTKVTAIEMFNKVHKGFGDMRKLIKKWAEKGIDVSFDEAKNEYTLNKLPAAK